SLVRFIVCKYPLIRMPSEFIEGRADCVLVYPSLYHEHVCIDAMGYRKKRVNASKNQDADKQKSENQDESTTPGKRPSLPAIEQATKRAARRELSPFRGHSCGRQIV